MINSITFTGREELLINAAEYAAQTAERKASQAAKAVEVVKASTVPSELTHPKVEPFASISELHNYFGDDTPVQAGKIINQLA